MKVGVGEDHEQSGGFVLHENLLWMTYYSARDHDKADIFLAKIDVGR